MNYLFITETYAAELDEGPTENHDLTPTGEGESQKEKHGLADVMAKILHKNVPVHKQVCILITAPDCKVT